MQAANLWRFDYDNIDSINLHYDFEERIVDENRRGSCSLYDVKFQEELSNIEKHRNTTDFSGNLVHYVISGRSKYNVSMFAQKEVPVVPVIFVWNNVQNFTVVLQGRIRYNIE